MWVGCRRRGSSGRRAEGSTRAEFGLVTLEWLLIVGAIAGIAAGSVLAVQRVVDNSTDRPAQRDVRVIDAEIAAASVAQEATEEEQANPSAYTGPRNLEFENRCAAVATEFNDVMDPANFDWVRPVYNATPPPDPVRAECNLTRT